MKRHERLGSYNLYVSLGTTCQTAYQLRRLGLRSYAGPLDWFVSSSAKAAARLIRNRFKGFMNINQLRLLGFTGDSFIVRDTVYEIDSFHDFPLTPNPGQWLQAYPSLREKIDRRVNRFLNDTVKNRSVLFIRTGTTKAEALELQSALQSVMKPKFQLLIVNGSFGGLKHVVYEDWGLDGICSARVPRGTDWKGSEEAWNTMMKG